MMMHGLMKQLREQKVTVKNVYTSEKMQRSDRVKKKKKVDTEQVIK